MSETVALITSQESDPTNRSVVGGIVLGGLESGGDAISPFVFDIDRNSAEYLQMQQIFAPIPTDTSDERLVRYVETNVGGQHEVDRLFTQMDAFTTAETRRASADRIVKLSQSDENFKALIETHCGKHSLPDEIVELIRYDAPLRLLVGEFMVSKVDNIISESPERIPRKVKDNIEKNPGSSPLKTILPDKMSGRTYAALLAVSMLDGSWNDAKVAAEDRIQFDDHGVAKDGQHEAMARQLVGTGGFTGESDPDIGDSWHYFTHKLGVPKSRSPELTMFDVGTLSMTEQCERFDMYMASAKNMYRTYANSEARSFRAFMGLPSDGPDIESLRGDILWATGNEVTDSEHGRRQLHRLITELFSAQGLLSYAEAQGSAAWSGDITGFSIAENEFNGVDANRLQNWLSTKIPSRFLQGATAIRRVDQAELGDRSENLDDGTQLNTVATFDVESGVISISYTSNIDPKNAHNAYLSGIIERDNPANKALEHVTHEIGHNVHFNVLTHGDLVAWMSVMRSEPTYPTAYVGASYKAGNQAGQRDDFAESFKLFVVDPQGFTADFPKRFSYMQKLFKKYSSRLLNSEQLH